MAKKDKKKNKDSIEQGNEDSAGSKVLTILIVLIIVLIWIAIFGVLIKLDVGKFGSQVLSPMLKDVPLINKILPDSGTEGYSGTYDYTTVGEAVAQIKELEKQLVSAGDTGKTDGNKIKELQAEVERLKVFESDQAAFVERVKEFDEKVVFGENAPSIEEYKAFYDSIQPENAERIYQSVVEKMQYTEKIKKQAEFYSKMEPQIAAEKFEVMTGELDLLASILDCMQPSKAGLILANMSAESAAQITMKMTSKAE